MIPGKKPTLAEYAVITIFGSVACTILGIAAMIVSINIPVEKHVQAMQLRNNGMMCLCLGMAIGLGYFLYRRYRD